MITSLWSHAQQLRYITVQTADTLLIGIVVIAILFVISVWFRQRLVSKTIAVCVAFVVPVIAATLLMVPSAYQGAPDNNCDKYKGGKLVFVLEDLAIRPVKLSDPYGADVLALLVRAPERWGDALHLCTVPRDSDKGRSIIKQVTGPTGIKILPGVTTIVFGRELEEPNITWRPKESQSFEKISPPEAPDPNN